MRRSKIYRRAVSLGIACGFTCLGTVQAANYLEGVGIARDGDTVVVSITTTASCEYNVFLTGEKPERIVVDLTGVTNELAEKQFIDLPLKSVKSIRTSQYELEPELQARVVLDIDRPIDFKDYRDGNSVIVKLPVVAGEDAFSEWKSSGGEAVYQSAVEKETETVSEAQAPAENAPVEEAKDSAVGEASVQDSADEQVSAEDSAAEDVTAVDSAGEQVSAEDSAGEQVSAKDSAAKQVSFEDSAIEDVQVQEEAVETVAIEPRPVIPPPPIQSMGIQVDTTPKRKTVEYIAATSKDPFKPLVGAGAAKSSSGLPSLENLKLVGILEDRIMSRALLEDAEGNGYMLKPNDRIQSGFLVSVTDNKAIFQVTEYGWTRTVALELQIPEIR
jgi:hypothetical protein